MLSIIVREEGIGFADVFFQAYASASAHKVIVESNATADPSLVVYYLEVSDTDSVSVRKEAHQSEGDGWRPRILWPLISALRCWEFVHALADPNCP